MVNFTGKAYILWRKVDLTFYAFLLSQGGLLPSAFQISEFMQKASPVLHRSCRSMLGVCCTRLAPFYPDHLLPRCSENIAGLELVFLSFLSRKDNLEELVPDPLDPNLQGRIWEAEHTTRTPMMLVPQQARDVRPGCCLHAADEPKHGPCITWLGSSMDESL